MINLPHFIFQSVSIMCMGFNAPRIIRRFSWCSHWNPISNSIDQT